MLLKGGEKKCQNGKAVVSKIQQTWTHQKTRTCYISSITPLGIIFTAEKPTTESTSNSQSLIHEFISYRQITNCEDDHVPKIGNQITITEYWNQNGQESQMVNFTGTIVYEKGTNGDSEHAHMTL